MSDKITLCGCDECEEKAKKYLERIEDLASLYKSISMHTCPKSCNIPDADSLSFNALYSGKPTGMA